ncbi:MAG: hypothetical protein R3F43_11930 [bacterium]
MRSEMVSTRSECGQLEGGLEEGDGAGDAAAQAPRGEHLVDVAAGAARGATWMCSRRV